MTRYGGCIASTSASTSAMMATGRSGDSALAAPRTTQGFLHTISSSTAVAKMAWSTRSILAVVAGANRSLSSEFQVRTSADVTLPIGGSPNLGSM